MVWDRKQLQQALKKLNTSPNIGFIKNANVVTVESIIQKNRNNISVFKNNTPYIQTTLHLAGFMTNSFNQYTGAARRRTINELLGQAHFGRRKGSEQRYYVVDEDIQQSLRLFVRPLSRNARTYRNSLTNQEMYRILHADKELFSIENK